VTFWAGNLTLPLRRKVDTSLFTYARKKFKTLGGSQDASNSVVADTFANLAPGHGISTAPIPDAGGGVNLSHNRMLMVVSTRGF